MAADKTTRALIVETVLDCQGHFHVTGVTGMATGKREIERLVGQVCRWLARAICHVPRGHHVWLRPTQEPAIGAMDPGPVRGPGPWLSRHCG